MYVLFFSLPKNEKKNRCPNYVSGELLFVCVFFYAINFDIATLLLIVSFWATRVE